MVMLAMFPLIVMVGGIMAQVGYLPLEENWGVEVLVGWNKARMESKEGRKEGRKVKYIVRKDRLW